MDKNTPPEERVLLLLKAAILQNGESIELNNDFIKYAEKYVLNIQIVDDKTLIDLDYK